MIPRLALALFLAASAPWPSPARAEPPRYLVLGSYLAEIVVALGEADRVVGVGGGTEHVGELAHLPVVRGFRQSSAEGLLSMAPTDVLIGSAFARPETLDQLRDAGIRVHVFPTEIATLDIVPVRIREIGRLTGRTAEAEALVGRFEADLADARAFASRATTRPRGLFILSGGGRPTLVAGGDTHVALLIDLAGGENVTAGITHFKPLSQEAMVEAAPDFILVNRDGLALKDGAPVALTAPGAALTPAAVNGRVFDLPGAYLQGLGILTPEAIRQLAARIHPDLQEHASHGR